MHKRFSFLSCSLLLIGIFLWNPHAVGQEYEEQGRKFNALLYYVNQLYVDDVDSEALVEAAIVGMLEEMDPHSVYIPEEELKAADEPLNGNFEGVGIQFNIFKDTIMVVSPISGGPSENLASWRVIESSLLMAKSLPEQA